MKWFHVQIALDVADDGLVHLTNDLAMLVAYVHSLKTPVQVNFACWKGAAAVLTEQPVTCLMCLAGAT